MPSPIRWQPDRTYAYGQIVLYEGRRYRARSASCYATPDTHTDHWESLGRGLTPSLTFATIERTEEQVMPYVEEFEVEEAGASNGARRCVCESCKMARAEGHKLRLSAVHQYNYRPRSGWRPRSLRDDPFSYHMGVELETDNYSEDKVTGRVNRSIFRNEFAADMRRPKTLWVPKRDGSVSGPEFVSQPATLSYWTSKQRELTEMFKMLLHAGYRSHQNDRCGMHVNISRTAFDGADHIANFLTLIASNEAWSIAMAQRTNQTASQWASFRGIATTERRNEIARRVAPTIGVPAFRRSYGEPYVTDKYTAVNFPVGEPRAEFRLPRGTLRIDRFFKNLEWTTAMLEYTRLNPDSDKCSPESFSKWAEEGKQKRMYPNLVRFMVERAPKLKDAMAKGKAEALVRAEAERVSREQHEREQREAAERQALYDQRRREERDRILSRLTASRANRTTCRACSGELAIHTCFTTSVS